ncbi:hypothetical protein [Actinomyces culturomici]|uniref:hypothetical protein n=1 Tax=Actinomyces culturomici TaxID=1926276 RepID=UPI000E200AF0|nr:hypothetical protein [Actinomyces culturomici]
MSDSTITAEGGEQTQGAGEAPAAQFEAITTQEDLDAIIEKRLARERRKFADYDDLKARAEGAEDTAKALADAQAKVKAFEHADEVRAWRAKASKEAGVPAELLRGDSLEELTEHAEQLKEFAKGRAPVVDGIASTPSVSLSSEQDLIRRLFGN